MDGGHDAAISREEALEWSETVMQPMIRSNFVARLLFDSRSRVEGRDVSFGQFHMSGMISHVRQSIQRIGQRQVPIAVTEALNILEDESCRALRVEWIKAHGDAEAVASASKPTPEEVASEKKKEVRAFLRSVRKMAARDMRTSIDRTQPAPAADEGGGASSSSAAGPADAVDDDAAERPTSLEEKIALSAEFNKTLMCSGGRSSQFKDYMRLIALIQLDCYMLSMGSAETRKHGAPATAAQVQKNARDAFFFLCIILWPGIADWLFSAKPRSDAPRFDSPDAREHLKQFVDYYVRTGAAHLLSNNIYVDESEATQKTHRSPIDEFVRDTRYHYMLIVWDEYAKMKRE